MAFEINGFDELQNKFKDLEQKVDAAQGHHDVELADILTNTFMAKYTNFPTLEAFFGQPGLDIKTTDDLLNIEDSKLDSFVKNGTKFDSWKDMKDQAVNDWALSQLGF